MKRVKRIGSSMAVVCGLLALSLVAPGCGDDDDDGDDVVGGTGGVAGVGGARAGSGGTRAGAGGTAGRGGSAGAGATGGVVIPVGGQGGAGEGGVGQGGTGGTPEGGTGGTPEGGTGGTPEGGTGGTPEGGTGGAEGGSSGEGGSGGSGAELECLDGCLSLLVPLTGELAQAQYFALQFATGQDLSESVVTFRVRVKGTYEGAGYIRGYANTPDFGSLTAGTRTNLSSLTGWTDITFDFNGRPAALADNVGQVGLEIGRDAGGTVSDVHIEVEGVTIVPSTLGPYPFTSATTDTDVLVVGFAQNVTGATRTWVAPY